MNMEQRILSHWVQLMIEFLVILLRQIGRFTSPRRIRVIDHVIFRRILVFPVLPLFFLSGNNLYRQKLAIFGQQIVHLRIFQEIFLFLADIHDNIRTSLGLFRLLQSVFRISLT